MTTSVPLPKYPKGGTIALDAENRPFYADYRGYDGIVTWHRLPWYAWRLRRRIRRDVRRGTWRYYRLPES